MAGYFQQLLDEARIPQRPEDTRLQEVAAYMEANLDRYTDQEIRGIVSQLGVQARLRGAERILASDEPNKVEQLTPIAQRDGTVNYQDTVDGATYELAQQEANPKRRNLILDEPLSGQATENAREAARILRASMAEADTESRAAIRSQIEAEPGTPQPKTEAEWNTLIDQRRQLAGVGGITQEVLTPDYTYNLSRIFNRFLEGDELNLLTVLPSLADNDFDTLYAALVKKIQLLPPAKSQKLATDLANFVRKESGLLVSSDYSAYVQLRQLADTLDPDAGEAQPSDPSWWQKAVGWTLGQVARPTVQAAFDIVPLGLAGVRAVKGVASLSGIARDLRTFHVGFRAGAPAIELGFTEGGARTLGRAATGADAETATARLGTTPGEVMGDLALPQLSAARAPLGARQTAAAAGPDGMGGLGPVQRAAAAGPQGRRTQRVAAGPKGEGIAARRPSRAGLKAIFAAGPVPVGKLIDGTVIYRSPHTANGRPFLADVYIPDAARDAQAARVRGELTETFSVRLNDTHLEPTEGGLQALVRLGDSSGSPWVEAEDASAWATATFKDSKTEWRLIQDDAGTFQVEFSQFYPTLVGKDLGSLADTAQATRFGIGRQFVLGEWLNTAISEAGRASATAGAQFKKDTETFFGLKSAKSSHVQLALDEAVARDAWHTLGEMAAKGFDPEMVKGYEEVRQLAEQLYVLKNQRLWLEAVDLGVVETTVAGKKVLLKSRTKPFTGEYAINLLTGQKVSMAGKHNLQLFDLFDDIDHLKVGFLPRGKTLTTQQPSFNILGHRGAFLPAVYNAAYFVRRVMPDGSTQAWKTARSLDAARREIAALKVAQPDHTYKEFFAQEIADELGTSRELVDAAERGLLYTSARRADALKDVEGGYAMLNVRDSVNQMVHSAANEAGMRLWLTAWSSMFKATYGKLFPGVELLGEPLKLASDASKATAEAFKNAARMQRFARILAGQDQQLLHGRLRQAQLGAASHFYNLGTWLRGKKLDRTGGVAQWFGNEIAGLNAASVSWLKTATFTAKIVLNTATMIPLQLSMIPGYIRLLGKHGQYAMRGDLFRDLAVLTTNAFGRGYANMAGRATGRTTQQVDQLIKEWENSAGTALSMNHELVAGTLVQGRVGVLPAGIKQAAQGLEMAKRVGFDAPVVLEQMLLFLSARAEILGTTGRTVLTGADGSRVADRMMQWSLNLNQTDYLSNPRGLFSLVLQFKGHPIKITERLLGAVGGTVLDHVPKQVADFLHFPGVARPGQFLKEAGITRAEQRAFVVKQFLFLGASGYGWDGFVRQANEKLGWNLPETGINLLINGYAGTTMNALIDVMLDTDEESDINWGLKFSPFSSAEMWRQNFVDFGTALVTGDRDAILETLPSAAGLGFVGDVAKALNAARHIAFDVPSESMPPPERALEAVSRLAQVFPLYTQTARAYWASRLGFVFDAQGNKVVEAGMKSAIGAIFGAKNYEQHAVEALRQTLGGKPGSGAEPWNVKEAVQATKSWMLPMVRAVVDGKRSPLDIQQMIEDHNITFTLGLEKHQHFAYREALSDAIWGGIEGRTLLQQYLDRLYDATGDKLDLPKESFKDTLYKLEFKGAEEARKFVEDTYQQAEELNSD